MSQQIKRLLVELDSLLDTRLAILHQIDPMLAKQVFDNPAYYTREWDDWDTLTNGVVSVDAFNERYANRDLETLKQAKPTAIVKILNEMTTFLDDQRYYMPDVDGVEVIVNTAPYRFSKNGLNALKTIIYSYCHFQTVVDTAYYPIETITPSQIKAKWDAVFLYDFNEWFEHHGETLSQVLIPRNQLIIPKRYLKSPDPLKDEYKQEVENQTVFELLQFACIERIELVMLNLSDFSILRHTGGS